MICARGRPPRRNHSHEYPVCMTAKDEAPVINRRSSSGSMSSTSPTVAAASAPSSTARSAGSRSLPLTATSAASSGISSGFAAHWSFSRPVTAPNTVSAAAPANAARKRLGMNQNDGSAGAGGSTAT